MKKISFFLIIVLLISSVAYGSLDDRIGNHWSKASIEESFIKGYFPYLADDNFFRFSPDGIVTRGEFSKSLSLLLKEYNYDLQKVDDANPISREKMANLLGGQLELIEKSSDENIVIPFKDIHTMDEQNINLLGLLYKWEIINGDSNTQFSPQRILSQAEAIITLQRVRGVLNEMDRVDTVAFDVISIVQAFTGKEEMVVIPQEDKVIVTITKEFPTPGYGMEIKSIIRTEDGHKISFDIQGPPSDRVQLQVITYKTISLEIDKEELGESPYNFILEGYNKIQ